MEILAFYHDLDTYRDRVLMLKAAAPRVGRIHLLTMAPPTPEQEAAFATSSLSITPVFHRATRRPVIQALAGVRMRALLKRVDVVHDTQGFLLGVMLSERARWRRRSKILFSCFTGNYEWPVIKRRWPSDNQYFVRRMRRVAIDEPMLAKLADMSTVFGEGHRAPFAARYGCALDRVRALPNCIDPAWFGAPSERVPSAVHGFEPGTVVLLFVGWVWQYKGIYELLQAMARLGKTHPELRLFVAGGPMSTEDVPAYAARLGVADRVRFAGRVSRATLSDLLGACEALVLPSYTEGSPRAVIEAMACGCGVVASRLPGTEALDPEGEFIHFVRRADADDLTRGIEALLSLGTAERTTRRRVGRDRYITHHTPVAAADALVNIYEDLVQRS